MKKVFSIFIAILFAISLTGCKKDDMTSVLSKVEKKVEKCSGYNLEAQMELINNEDSYKYDVSVSYKEDDNFRVSLRNKTNNHEQIILKNEDGVYVLTPNLNKSFKFQSKWPHNNSQSYLLQSVIKDMKEDKSLSMKKTDDGYIFRSTVNFKNNASLTHQEVVVDSKHIIKSVSVLDNEGNIGIKVVFDNIDFKAKFDDDYFSLEENMEASVSIEEDVLNTGLEDAIYPMYLPEGTYLENEKTIDLDEGSRIILTFAGDKSFMLVEETALRNDEMVVIPTSGDLELFMDTILIVDDSSLSWISGDVEYYLVSSELNTNELVNIAKSISVLPVGK